MIVGIHNSLAKREKLFLEANKTLQDTQTKLFQTEKLLDEKISMNDSTTKELMKFTELIKKYEEDQVKVTAQNEELSLELLQLKAKLEENSTKLQEKDKTITKLSKKVFLSEFLICNLSLCFV